QLPPSSISLPLPAPHHHPHSFPTRRSSDLSYPQAWKRFCYRSANQRESRPSFASGAVRPAERRAIGVVWRGRRGWCRTFFGLSPDRKSTRLNSSHVAISYAVFCLKKKNIL